MRELSTYGFWSMAHQMRTDFAMLLGALCLLIVGGGRWSVDANIAAGAATAPAKSAQQTDTRS